MEMRDWGRKEKPMGARERRVRGRLFRPSKADILFP